MEEITQRHQYKYNKKIYIVVLLNVKKPQAQATTTTTTIIISSVRSLNIREIEH